MRTYTYTYTLTHLTRNQSRAILPCRICRSPPPLSPVARVVDLSLLHGVKNQKSKFRELFDFLSEWSVLYGIEKHALDVIVQCDGDSDRDGGQFDSLLIEINREID